MPADYLFTAAILGGTSRKSCTHFYPCFTRACLVFSSTLGTLDLEDPELHKEIASSEVVRKLLGDTFAILPYNKPATNRWGGGRRDRQMLVATNRMDRYLLQNLDSTAYYPLTLVNSRHLQHTNFSQLQLRCSLPERFVHDSCRECPAFEKKSITGGCALSDMHNDENPPGFDLDDYVGAVKYHKTKAGRFVAVGPSLTAREVVSAGHREIPEHYFDQVENKFELRSRAAREQYRRRYFAREVCPTCSMRIPCHALNGDRGSKRCDYAYPATLANDIIEKVANPFTDRQLFTLLANSGPLDHRVDRLITYASLRMKDNALYFALVPRTLHYRNRCIHSNATADYETAMGWLHRYNDHVTTPNLDKKFKLDNVYKALILQSAATNRSPYYRHGWGMTDYALISIESQKHTNILVSRFLRNNYRRTPLPWITEMSTLEDYFSNYGHFSLYPDKPPHPLSLSQRGYTTTHNSH